ncbi:unnamed protein product [Owenia fusiformis]|nr:unnamed protein product [Owenia fusiformis]
MIVGTSKTAVIESIAVTLPQATMSPIEAAMEAAKQACYETVLTLPYPDDGRLYCNRTFDSWGCWNDTLAGTKAYTKCPGFIKGFDPGLSTAFKDCNKDGTWWRHPKTNKSWANYTPCVNMGDFEKNRMLIYTFISGYTVSILALAVSLGIFCFFKQLQCDRITLHKNLFVSYILTGLVWILYYVFAALDAQVLIDNPWWCRALHVICSYFTACNFLWMFCEGLYLHTIIVCTFTSGKTLMIVCYLLGWGLSIINTTIYTIIRSTHPTESQRCWTDESELMYINAGTCIASILINSVFLISIIRVLITKLRAVNSPDTNQTSNPIIENSAYTATPMNGSTIHSQNSAPLIHTPKQSFIGVSTRKATRAILILVPLLGLQYLFILYRPDTDERGLQIYSIISAFVTSFQGLFVACIYCFFNGEVIAIMKRKWGQHKLMRGGRRGSSRRGTLYSTQITSGEVPKPTESHVNTDL